MASCDNDTIKCIEINGDRFWFQNDRRHRLDGPAVEFTDGSKIWYQNDRLHRTDGPAIEYAHGTKKWYQNGQLHRTDGPAVKWADRDQEYWIDGVKYDFEQFKLIAFTVYKCKLIEQ